MENLMTFFAWIGICAVALILVMFIVEVLLIIKGIIKTIRRKYIQKHRFSKLPTAKCYCVDCICHSDNGSCLKFEGWNTADEWFCWSASPKK